MIAALEKVLALNFCLYSDCNAERFITTINIVVIIIKILTFFFFLYIYVFIHGCILKFISLSKIKR